MQDAHKVFELCVGREARGKRVGGEGSDCAGHVEFTTRAD